MSTVYDQVAERIRDALETLLCAELPAFADFMEYVSSADTESKLS